MRLVGSQCAVTRVCTFWATGGSAGTVCNHASTAVRGISCAFLARRAITWYQVCLGSLPKLFSLTIFRYFNGAVKKTPNRLNRGKEQSREVAPNQEELQRKPEIFSEQEAFSLLISLGCRLYVRCRKLSAMNVRGNNANPA